MDKKMRYLLGLKDKAKKVLGKDELVHLVGDVAGRPTAGVHDLVYDAALKLECSLQDVEALAKRWNELELAVKKAAKRKLARKK